ncbi:DUF4198 domain-containing protein [Bacillus sp. JCM 19034]|uniref:DUF4198 domain-containing protein n=1 Tax=Bacillus sp. JCM 19034 TaxID=1481928 RepID=UPI0009E876E2|nr:DUF4198 domain-containing protein [Bacillus sp. JCM 19034]
MLSLVLMGVLLFAVLFTQTTVAHDGWSQTNSPIIEAGEVSYVELLFGNHSNDHASYRIDGTWNSDNSSVFVTTPTGEKIDISDTLFYTGELSEVDGAQAGVNNYYVASFSSSTPGAYIVSVEGDSIFAHGDEASRTLRNAKSFVAINDIPVISQVKDFEGFDQQVSPDRAEFVPLFNPAAITPEEELSVALFLHGEPLADTDVSLIRRSTSDAEVITTNADGIATFTVGEADYYLMRAKPYTDEGKEGEFDKTNYEATMTFVVQNGAGHTTEELSNNTTEILQNPFLLVSIFLFLGLLVSLILLFRKSK